jgi:hypothetical protein
MVILCDNCGKKEKCPRAQAGQFCMRWEPKEKKPRPGDDPNELWSRGEDAE